MKQACTDLKSFVTVAFTLTIIALVFITVFKSADMFQLVFVLFTNIATAVFTYYFTKKKEDKETSIPNESEETKNE